MDGDVTRDERLAFHLHISRDQRATGDYGFISDLAVVRDVPRGHDVVSVADHRLRFGRGAARNGEMLTDLVSIPDPEITAVTFKILVQRIGAEYGAGRNLIALAERGPALDVNVGLQTRLRPNHHILFDDGILADHYARAEDGIAMHSCRGGDLSGGGDPRGRRHRSGDR